MRHSASRIRPRRAASARLGLALLLFAAAGATATVVQYGVLVALVEAVCSLSLVSVRRARARHQFCQLLQCIGGPLSSSTETINGSGQNASQAFVSSCDLEHSFGLGIPGSSSHRICYRSAVSRPHAFRRRRSCCRAERCGCRVFWLDNRTINRCVFRTADRAAALLFPGSVCVVDDTQTTGPLRARYLLQTQMTGTTNRNVTCSGRWGCRCQDVSSVWRTAGMVRISIAKSLHSDHLRT
jgi:hypothetical protein